MVIEICIMLHLAGLLHERKRVDRVEVAWASEHWKMTILSCTIWTEHGNIGMQE